MNKLLLLFGLLVAAGAALAGISSPATVNDAAALVASADRNCRALPTDFSSPPVAGTTPPASLWQGWEYGPSLTLAVSPATALVDQPLSIRVRGLEPGEPVSLRASMTGYRGRKWHSTATFKANKHGVVDVTRAAPRYGSYAGVHAMGLVWSMMPGGVKNPATAMYYYPHGGAKLHIAAVANGRKLASINVVRMSRDPQVKVRKVMNKNLVGFLFSPAKPGPHPGVIVLGGSEGGLHPQIEQAALLASHGYVALGLAYFQGYAPNNPMLADLPKKLVNIPLEYFKHAAEWLQEQPGVPADRIGIIGWSKGAEAALLVASNYPRLLHAVVAYAPSSEAWAGLNRGGPPVASWTLKGQPVAFVQYSYDKNAFNRKTMSVLLRNVYLNPIAKGGAAVARAVIPVWRINGPVLLLSGSDDKIWPSSLFAARIMKRLQQHHHGYADESLCYEGAGHLIALWPYRPSVATAAKAGPVSLLMGGSQLATAWSATDSWPRILAFLQRALTAETSHHD